MNHLGDLWPPRATSQVMVGRPRLADGGAKGVKRSGARAVHRTVARAQVHGMLHVARKKLESYSVVLASQSPRRKELLTSLGVTFETIVSRFDEDLDKSKFPDAADYAAETAFHKVADVAKMINEDADRVSKGRYLIIGSDTVVDLDGEGKLFVLFAERERILSRESLTLPSPFLLRVVYSDGEASNGGARL